MLPPRHRRLFVTSRLVRAAVILVAVGAPLWAAETFEFSGDRVSMSLAEGRQRTLLVGNAWVRSDATEISADEIELLGDDYRFAVCRGNVRVEDEEKGILLRSQNLFFDRERKISRVEGYAEMEDRKNEVVVKGGYLEHRDEEDLTIIQIGVRIFREDMACRAEFARYRRGEDILELSGMPVVFWDGDEYRATRITVNLETEEFDLEGDVSGAITGQKEEEDTEDAPTSEDAASTESSTPRETAEDARTPNGREEPDDAAD
jgi:lipopolysaccharide export system protein LptA